MRTQFRWVERRFKKMFRMQLEFDRTLFLRRVENFHSFFEFWLFSVGPIGPTKTKNKNTFSFLILLSPTKRDKKCRQKQKRVYEKLFLWHLPLAAFNSLLGSPLYSFSRRAWSPFSFIWSLSITTTAQHHFVYIYFDRYDCCENFSAVFEEDQTYVLDII